MAKYLDSAGITYLWGQIKGGFVAKDGSKVLSTNDFTTELKTKLEGIEEGAQKNVITGIKLGTADLTPAGGVVTIDAYTKGETDTAIATAVANSKHASFEKADSIPTAETAKENVIYLVMNETTKHYDMYAKVGNNVELLDDTTVDLTNYFTKDQVTSAITEATKNKVDKDGDKVLSTNDYTTADKDKLTGIASGAQVNVIESIKVNGSAVNPDESKAVNITVPTKVSQLSDAADYLKGADAEATYAKKTELPTIEALSNDEILAAINGAQA